MNFSFQQICHPATLELLRYQSSAKLTRMLGSLKNPRRQLLSAVAIILGLLWVSQAIASVMLRESADPEKLKIWLPLGLFVYSAWHLVKTVVRATVEPFEWTPAENELVRAAPLSRTQIISYRLASIVGSSIAKALCFSVIMIPDLNLWIAGFLGMWLGLMFVDLVRVSFELIYFGLSRRGRIACRVLILSAVAGCVGWSLSVCLFGVQAEQDIASPGAMIFLMRFVGTLVELGSTPLGLAATGPFRSFTELILVSQVSIHSLGLTGFSVALVGLMAVIVYRLDGWAERKTQTKEESAYTRGLKQTSPARVQPADSHATVAVPWRIAGFGSLVWRQLLGAYHYRLTLLVSLGVPTLLCCIPLLADHSPFIMLINIVGGVVFYSFLLLPAALMLDFRRDVQRIVVLKSLPIGPLATTLGQIAAPVIICSAFQWGVLAIAAATGSVIAWQAILAGLLLIPVNQLIFAIENYIFLLAPYRRNQEGLDVFLRTILTFTAKGFMFAVALSGTLAWAFAAKYLAAMIGSSSAIASLIFSVGLWGGACLLAAIVTWGVMRLYVQFDPSQDAPAIS